MTTSNTLTATAGSGFINNMFELGNEQEAVEKATEIMQVHLGDDSDERIKLKQSIGPITELDSEVFNELMKQ